MDPPQYEAAVGAMGATARCAYCGADCPPAGLEAHLVAAHAELLFHCEECDTYVDRRDFILHMSVHAVQYAGNGDTTGASRTTVNGRGDEDENTEERECPEISPGPDGERTVSEPGNGTEEDKNEFSDHSDAENCFGPLPESVFEAIEDSQDSQPAEESIASAEGSVAPAEGSVALAEGSVALAEGSVAPAEESVARAEGSVAPAEESVALAEGSVSPAEGSVAPAEGSVALAEGSVAHTEESDAHADESVATAGESIATAGGCDASSLPPPTSEVPSEPSPAEKIKPHKRTRTCPICSKVFTASSSYFYHVKHYHARSKEHECDVCGKKFATRANLVQHGPVHTGECHFACALCGKRFKSKASHYIHAQTHSDVKKYTCAQCHKTFRWRTHLLRHMKRHAGEKSHLCTVCGRGFSIKCDLLRHARTHAAGNFACDKCGHKFAQMRYLNVHMERKHSVSQPSAVLHQGLED